MTRKQVKNLCAEFGIEMVSFPRRMYYCDYLVGSFYPDNGSYKMRRNANKMSSNTKYYGKE